MTTTTTTTRPAAPALTAPADQVKNWRDQGVCVRVDPDVFFPARGESSRTAKWLCARCPIPVRVACLEDALRRDEPGIRAGLTQRERRAIRRERRENGSTTTGIMDVTGEVN